MTEDDGKLTTELFNRELEESLGKLTNKYNVTLAEVIGVLELLKLRCMITGDTDA